MNNLPIHPTTPKQQEQFLQQLYTLMARQVQSYHKHRHMGSSTSIPTELAQDLLESIDYTANQAGGLYARPCLEETLRLGQAILEEKLNRAQSMLRLIHATAPSWQTECRLDALSCLRHYLDGYDHRHLAHKAPDGVFYPIPITPPEGIRGMDSCLFLLNVLWLENQIMSAFPDDTLEQLWDRLPADSLNQCEQLILNAVGKLLIGADPNTVIFSPDAYLQLVLSMSQTTEESLRTAANKLCQNLKLKNDLAETYIKTTATQIAHHICPFASIEAIDNLFV